MGSSSQQASTPGHTSAAALSSAAAQARAARSSAALPPQSAAPPTPMRTTRAMAKATGAEIIKPTWAVRSPRKQAAQPSSKSSFLGLGAPPGGAPGAAERRSSLEAGDGLDVPQDPRREALRNSVGRRSASPPLVAEAAGRAARTAASAAAVASSEAAAERRARRMLQADKAERTTLPPVSASSPIKRTLSRPAGAASPTITERSRAGATSPTKKVASSRAAVRPASSPIKTAARPTSPVKVAPRTPAADSDRLATERGADGLRRKLSVPSARTPSTLPRSPAPPVSARREATRPTFRRETSDEDDSLRSSPSFDSLLPPASPAYTHASPVAPPSARRPLARRVSQEQEQQVSPVSSERMYARSPSVSPTLALATLAPARERLAAHTPPRPRPGLAPGLLRPSPGSARRGIFRHEPESEDELHGVGDEAKYLTPGPAVKANKLGLQVGSEDENEVPSKIASARRVRTPLKPREARAPMDAATNVASTRETTTSSSLASTEAGLAKPPSSRHRHTSSAFSSPEDKKIELADLISQKRGVRDVLSPPAPLEGSPSKRTLGGGARMDRQRSSSPIKPASSSILTSRYPTSSGTTALRTKATPAAERESEVRASPVRRESYETSAASASEDDALNQATAEAEARRMAAEVVARVRQGRRKSLAAIKPLSLPDAAEVIEETPAENDVELEQRLIGGVTATPETPEQRAARRAAKHQRRKSLYVYVPTKRDDLLGNEVTPPSDSAVNNSTAIALSKSPTTTPPPTRFLRGLRILVDVRDQDGEDASSAWVTMLKEWGARVFLRPPTVTPDGASTLSHIVYKGGRPSTLHAFRSAPEPKPLLVGVSWVLSMLQEGRKTDETAYLVEIGKEAVFRKKRASMAPKAAPAGDGELTLEALRGPVAQEVALAYKKKLTNQPAQPSPLACAWRPGSSTASEGGTSILI